MKRLILTSVIMADKENDNHSNNKIFSPNDLVDIFNQVEEIDCNIAIKNDDEGRLLLLVGDSIYSISSEREKSHPRRRLLKMENL